jgi:hypothetical protein
MSTYDETAARAEAERRAYRRYPEAWHLGHDPNANDRIRAIGDFLAAARWQAEQEPTEAEVEAGARALNPMAWEAYDRVDEDSEMRETLVEHTRVTARAVLRAAKQARS